MREIYSVEKLEKNVIKVQVYFTRTMTPQHGSTNVLMVVFLIIEYGKILIQILILDQRTSLKINDFCHRIV